MWIEFIVSARRTGIPPQVASDRGTSSSSSLSLAPNAAGSASQLIKAFYAPNDIHSHTAHIVAIDTHRHTTHTCSGAQHKAHAPLNMNNFINRDAFGCALCVHVTQAHASGARICATQLIKTPNYYTTITFACAAAAMAARLENENISIRTVWCYITDDRLFLCIAMCNIVEQPWLKPVCSFWRVRAAQRTTSSLGPISETNKNFTHSKSTACVVCVSAARSSHRSRSA